MDLSSLGKKVVQAEEKVAKLRKQVVWIKITIRRGLHLLHKHRVITTTEVYLRVCTFDVNVRDFSSEYVTTGKATMFLASPTRQHT